MQSSQPRRRVGQHHAGVLTQALLEQVMILGLGLVIGGIIISILLAILKVNSLVG